MKGSPWLEEYDRVRPVAALADDEEADVAVVGGGISGLTAAWSLLRAGDLTVTLLEKGLVGHGATGYNGGQVVAAFERRYDDLAGEHGEERVDEGFRELRGAWELLRAMLRSMGSEDLLQMVPAQLGIAGLENLRSWEHELERRGRMGLSPGRLRVADDARWSSRYAKDVELVYRDVLEDLLWTQDHRYLAALEVTVGLMNSYVFTERMAEHLLAQYPDRFRLWEDSPVDRIRLSDEEAVLTCRGRIVRADRVVLCTNGYRPPRIEACVVPAVNGRVQGVVGYMLGSTDQLGVAGARAYFNGGEEPYFYLTRRRHLGSWLTAVGGPEGPIEGDYDPRVDYRPEAYDRLEAFMGGTLLGPLGVRDHRWQGLMGYTPTGIRVVGRDPNLPALYYDLGCNGIGILSAVAGADRLARVMGGQEVAPSMFDTESSLALRTEKEVQRTR